MKHQPPYTAWGERLRRAFLSYYASPAVLKLHLTCQIGQEILRRLHAVDVAWCRAFLGNPYAHVAVHGRCLAYELLDDASSDHDDKDSRPETGCSPPIDSRTDDETAHLRFVFALHDIASAVYCVESRLMSTAGVVNALGSFALSEALLRNNGSLENAHELVWTEYCDRMGAAMGSPSGPTDSALQDLAVWESAAFEVPMGILYAEFEPAWTQAGIE